MDDKSEEKKSVAVSVLCDAERAETRGVETLASVSNWLTEQGYTVVAGAVFEQNAKSIENAFRALSLDTDAWIVCGATGIGPSDIAPQMLARLSEFPVPGVGELLRAESLKFSHNAPISRCGAYVSKGRVILSIPGNNKAALEQLGIVRELLPELIAAARGKCKGRKKV